MCRSRIFRTIHHLRSTISWYFGLGGGVALLAVALLILTYLPNHVFAILQEKALGNLVTIFFGAVSGFSIKEVLNKRDKILMLEFVMEEYEELDRIGSLPGSPERAATEDHCVVVIEKILGAS